MARFFCDAIVPVLIFLISLEPFLYPADRPWSARLRKAFDFWLWAALAVAIAVTLAESGKAYEVWPGHHGFPSGHATMSSALAAVLVLHRGLRWAKVAVPLALLMGLALYFNRSHAPIEIIAGLFLGPIVVLTIWWLTRRYAQKRYPSS